MRSKPWAPVALLFLLGGMSVGVFSGRAQNTADPSGQGQTADQLAAKRDQLMAVVPSQRARIEYALKDVDRIITFADLGVGERLEIISPATRVEGWPIGRSVKEKLSRGRTAIALRCVLDTLTGPRVAGRGHLAIMGVHCGETAAGQVEIPGVYGSNGTLRVSIRENLPFLTPNCCDQPPTIWYNSFADYGDTLLALYVFDPRRTVYTIHLIGPNGSRGLAGFKYCSFRTERGFLHPDAAGQPYDCACADSATISLAIGMVDRENFDQTEPRLRAVLF